MQTCFAVMSFADKYRQVYDGAIAPAARNCGYEPRRADESLEPANIISKIVRAIIEADVVVADISEPLPNVFYELGLSHSVGNKTVMITSSAYSSIPFDISPFRAINYDLDRPGLELLSFKIESALGDLQRQEFLSPNNPIQEAGKEFFDLRARVLESLEDLKGQRRRAAAYSVYEELRAKNHLQDNSAVADRVVHRINRHIVGATKPLVVCLCGSGACGKSTFASLLAERIRGRNDNSHSVDVLPTDSYMRPRAVRIQRNITGFGPASHDLTKLSADVASLRRNISVSVAPYDHATGEHGEPRTIRPTDVLILEGIYSFYPSVSVPESLKYYIFSDQHKAKELKFLADWSERGYDAQTAFAHADWEYSTYETHILPYLRIADFCIGVDEYWKYEGPYPLDPPPQA